MFIQQLIDIKIIDLVNVSFNEDLTKKNTKFVDFYPECDTPYSIFIPSQPYVMPLTACQLLRKRVCHMYANTHKVSCTCIHV